MTDTKIKPVAFRVDYTAAWSMGRDRFFGEDDQARMQRHLTPASIVNNLYDEAALEAARQEGRNESAMLFNGLEGANAELRAKLAVATEALETIHSDPALFRVVDVVAVAITALAKIKEVV